MSRPRPQKPLDFYLVSLNKQNQAPATLQSVEYRCQIVNNILKTTLVQTFRSKSENEFSETLYYFPVEENICLESFEARFNEKTVKGIVKDKNQAKKEYQENKNQGNFVSYASFQKDQLEEYVKIKLGNLPPNQQVDIVLNFSQQLGSILNKYYYAYIPIQYVEDEVSAKMGKNVLTLDLFCTGKITYANSKGYPADKVIVDENTARFTLSQALIQKDVHFQLIFSYQNMFDPQVIIGSSKVYHEDSVKKALLPAGHSAFVSFIPNFNEEITQELDDTIRAAINNGDDIFSDEFQQKLNQEMIDHLNSSRSEFLFLLDRSGSMSGKPIQKACEALTLFLKSLPNDSYFNVISFGSGFEKLFPKSKKYDTDSLNQAISILSQYSANLGGTEIYNPLVNIFNDERIKGYNKQIFLLTDGEVDQPQNVVSLIKKNNKFNRVHSIGFGSGADKYLIQQSAVAGKGISKIVDLNCDLSEVIIDMLSTSITPTFDEFSILYDKTVFDSSYPSSTNFPCVFKDEIINIHFFFKPLVELSNLTDAQKLIQIQYYDSHLKQHVKKEIKLEMADCFTCNPELQESVFKLGKQLYLNENITAQQDGSELVQQAIDYQLLTEKTALICVIEELNDEKKIMYQHLDNSVVYQNQKQQYSPKNLSQAQAQFYSPVQYGIQQSPQSINPYAVHTSSIQNCMAQVPPSPPLLQNYPSQQNQPVPSSFPPPYLSYSSQQSQMAPPPPPGLSTYGSPFQYQSFNQVVPPSPGYCSQGYSIPQNQASFIPNSPQLDLCENKCSLSNNINLNNNNNNNNVFLSRSQSDSECYDEEEEGECYYNIQTEDDNDEYCNMEKEQEREAMDCKDSVPNIPHPEIKPVYQSNSLDCEKLCSEEVQMKVAQKKRKSSLQQKQVIPTLKLDNILKLVDSQGVWLFDQSIINQCSSLDQDSVQQLSSQFTSKDAFMTLFMLIILELFYSADKTKWVLISKKSSSFIKKNIKQGLDFNILKQQISEEITN